MTHSLHDLITLRCCHACKEGLSDDFGGAFHTNAQILTCAPICEVCSAIAKYVLEEQPPKSPERPPFCKANYTHVLEIEHTDEWTELDFPELEGQSIPFKSWMFTKSLDRSGVCIQSQGDYNFGHVPDDEIVGKPILHSSVAKKLTAMKRWYDEDVFTTRTVFDGTAFPTRLLDLRLITEHSGKKRNTLLGDVYLRERDSSADATSNSCDAECTCQRYATLSYRWSSNPNITTSISKYKQFTTEGIDVQGLPQLFKDAIFVTKCLGLNYLWIDALCIIQDDEYDWKWEASKMGDIYARSSCTIAVHPDPDQPLKSVANTSFLAVAAADLEEEYTGEDLMSDFDDLVQDSELSSRGWVMQERVLSPRIIHFAGGRTFWDSRRTGTFEYTATVPWVHRQRVTDVSLSLFHMYWFDLVERFSRCALTYEGDKLYAIAGIANHVMERIDVSYVNGLWYDSFYCGLLWMASEEALQKPQEKRAPSWSWASRNGPVSHPWKHAFGRLPITWPDGPISIPWVPNKGRDQVYDIEGMSLGKLDSAISDLGLCGDIVCFWTRLKAIMLPAECYSKKPEVDEQNVEEEVDGDSVVRHATLRQLESACVDMEGENTVHLLNDDNGIEFGWLSFDDGYCTYDKDVKIWLAHIATVDYILAGIGEEDQTSLCCLIVVESKTGRGEEIGYVRIGSGVMYDVEWFKDIALAQVTLA